MNKLIAVGVLAFTLLILSLMVFRVVGPGEVGVSVNMGHLNEAPLKAGLNVIVPFVTTIHKVSLRQQNQQVKAECYSKDLQQVSLTLNILYHVPEVSAIPIFRDYSGDPFDTLIVPRVLEAIKEVTANDTAEDLVKNREKNKIAALAKAREKIGTILSVDDLTIANVDLSNDLEKAIESKMVADQDAKKAVFIKLKAQQEADAVVIRAEGEAKGIKITGDALQQNPSLVQFEMVKKWDGRAPQIVGTGTNIMLPMPTPVGK